MSKQDLEKINKMGNQVLLNTIAELLNSSDILDYDGVCLSSWNSKTSRDPEGDVNSLTLYMSYESEGLIYETTIDENGIMAGEFILENTGDMAFRCKDVKGYNATIKFYSTINKLEALINE